MESPGNPGTLQRMQEGERLGNYFTWSYAGIDENGNWLVWNKDNTEKFNSELENNLRLLRKRDSLLINGLKEVGFKIIQTTSSFYVTFYANNAYELAEKLESKHVFLVPLSNNLIRIAVSGLNIEEISKLPSIIKETYNEQ